MVFLYSESDPCICVFKVSSNGSTFTKRNYAVHGG